MGLQDLWKLTSPMWLEGSALYVILKLPIAWMPDLWDSGSYAWLQAVSYVALGGRAPLRAVVVSEAGTSGQMVW